MKYITLIIGLLVMGCGTPTENTTKAKPVKELTLEEKVTGVYVAVYKRGEVPLHGTKYEWILKADGEFLYREDGVVKDKAKWSVIDRSKMEILADYPDGADLVYKYDGNGTLTENAVINEGNRTEPNELRKYIKIK
jgi:hypothetical protein